VAKLYGRIAVSAFFDGHSVRFFFGPVKYSILPPGTGAQRVSGGNGSGERGHIVAITAFGHHLPLAYWPVSPWNPADKQTACGHYGVHWLT